MERLYLYLRLKTHREEYIEVGARVLVRIRPHLPHVLCDARIAHCYYVDRHGCHDIVTNSVVVGPANRMAFPPRGAGPLDVCVVRAVGDVELLMTTLIFLSSENRLSNRPCVKALVVQRWHPVILARSNSLPSSGLNLAKSPVTPHLSSKTESLMPSLAPRHLFDIFLAEAE